jgi:hypothetical protein
MQSKGTVGVRMIRTAHGGAMRCTDGMADRSAGMSTRHPSSGRVANTYSSNTAARESVDCPELAHPSAMADARMIVLCDLMIRIDVCLSGLAYLMFAT